MRNKTATPSPRGDAIWGDGRPARRARNRIGSSDWDPRGGVVGVRCPAGTSRVPRWGVACPLVEFSFPLVKKRASPCEDFVSPCDAKRYPSRTNAPAQIARLLRPNSPTGCPQRPIGFASIARGVRFNRPQGFEGEPTGFLRRGGGVSISPRRVPGREQRQRVPVKPLKNGPRGGTVPWGRWQRTRGVSPRSHQAPSFHQW